jgi:hypothetical protein
VDVLRVTQLRMTCGGCPSQWEGVTDDGQSVYIRYRHGVLSCGAGETMDAAVDASAGWYGREPLYVGEHGGEHDGFMDTGLMLRHLQHVLVRA